MGIVILFLLLLFFFKLRTPNHFLMAVPIICISTVKLKRWIHRVKSTHCAVTALRIVFFPNFLNLFSTLHFLIIANGHPLSLSYHMTAITWGRWELYASCETCTALPRYLYELLLMQHLGSWTHSEEISNCGLPYIDSHHWRAFKRVIQMNRRERKRKTILPTQRVLCALECCILEGCGANYSLSWGKAYRSGERQDCISETSIAMNSQSQKCLVLAPKSCWSGAKN